MMRCLVGFALGSLLLTLPPLPAQAQDPQQRPAVLRVELADGTAVPGVPIRRPLGPPAAGLDRRDGWLRDVPSGLVEAAWPEVGRTDPDGKLVLMTQEGALDARDVRVGAPFQLLGFGRSGSEYQLLVERHEQFVVRTTDAVGQPLVRFPMVLRQNDRDVAFAVTDARGVATFGVAPRDRARLVVVPFGWLGPTDAFPTVAAQLPDKQVPCTVPPFVHVRVRTMVGGVAMAAGLRGARLLAPRSATWQARQPAAPPWLGVEIGPVAVGETLRGQLHLPVGDVPFTVQVAATADGVQFVDVEADPPRPQFALQLVAPGLRQAKASSRIGEGPTIAVNVLLQVVTESGSFPCPGEIDDTGRVRFDPNQGQVRGQKIVRLDLDVTETAVAVVDLRFERTTRVWSGSRAVDHALAAGLLELGAFEVAPHQGVLRGRVVDEAGEPVALATIDVEVVGGPATQRLWSEQDGRFELWGPLLRAADGTPGQVVATASLGQGPDMVRGEPSPAQSQCGTATLVLKRPAKGLLQLTLRTPPAVSSHALQLQWVGADGKVLDLGRERAQWRGSALDACTIGPLPPGRGALRILLRPGVLLRTIDGLEIAVGKAVSDARLVDLDLADAVTTCRMRVVDEEGVPIAGARVEYRGASDQWSIGPSDGGGLLEIIKGPAKALRIVVTAAGKQPLEVDEVRDGGELRLRPLPNLCVVVKGLPADVPRQELAVFLRSVVRENLVDQAQALLGPGDTAYVPLPPAGRYHLRLTLARASGGGTSWTFVGQRPDDVLVGKDGETLEFTVDAAMLTNLRELLKK